ncbi:MAG: hypothetical protein ACYDHZ_04945 [Dehalococcoidia bacterium]|jgi:hypothetical protein
MRSELDLTDVVIAPPGVFTENLAEKVAAILNKDFYGTRLLLAGNIPRIVARHTDMDEAKATVQSLKAAGITAFMCKDSELHKPAAARFSAHSLKLEEGKVTFRDNNNKERSVQAGKIFLILQATAQTYLENESVKTRMKFSLPRTILLGGVPVWRKVKEKSKDVTVQATSFIRLYERPSMEPAIEILQNNFDYSFLGQKMTSSARLNLRATALELRDAFPLAAFDDRLAKSLGAGGPFASPHDSIELICTLIYLYHREVSHPGGQG